MPDRSEPWRGSRRREVLLIERVRPRRPRPRAAAPTRCSRAAASLPRHAPRSWRQPGPAALGLPAAHLSWSGWTTSPAGARSSPAAASGIGRDHGRAASRPKACALVLAGVERPCWSGPPPIAGRGRVPVCSRSRPTRASAAEVGARRRRRLERFGDVHLLCNSAGVGEPAACRCSRLPLADFRVGRSASTSSARSIRTAGAFLPHLVANDVGHIVDRPRSSGALPPDEWARTAPRRPRSSPSSETLQVRAPYAEGEQRRRVRSLCPSAGSARTHLGLRTATDRSASRPHARRTDQMAQAAEYKAKLAAAGGDDRRRRLRREVAGPGLPAARQGRTASTSSPIPESAQPCSPSGPARIVAPGRIENRLNDRGTAP